MAWRSWECPRPVDEGVTFTARGPIDEGDLLALGPDGVVYSVTRIERSERFARLVRRAWRAELEAEERRAVSDLLDAYWPAEAHL